MTVGVKQIPPMKEGSLSYITLLDVIPLFRRVGSGVRLDPLRFLAGCRKR